MTSDWLSFSSRSLLPIVMPSHHSLVVFFDVVVLMAIVLSLCTFLPAILSKNVHRSIGWYSLIAAWLVYSLSYALLIGKQEGPDPPFGLCVFQTLLIYAVPTLVATGMSCYYIEFSLIVYGLRSGNPNPYSSWRTFWLVVIPWLVFLSVILEVLLLIFPGKRLNRVERAGNNFYCHLGDNIPDIVSATLVIVNMVILVPLEVWTGYTMYRHWDVFRRLTRRDRQIFLAVYLRLFFSTVAAVIAFALSTLAFVFPAPDETSLVYPILPIFIAIAFGTQKDLMRVWIFWYPHRPYGSIVFNYTGGGSTSRGGPLTTNIYTSQGAITDSNATTTESEAQSQLQKPKVITGDSSGLPLERLAAESLGLQDLSSPLVPGVSEKPCIVPPHVEQTVHFELQERSHSQASAPQQQLGEGTLQPYAQDQ